MGAPGEAASANAVCYRRKRDVQLLEIFLMRFAAGGSSAGRNEKERNTKEKEQKEKAGALTPIHSRAPCALALLAPVTRFPHCWAAHLQHGVDAHSLGGRKHKLKSPEGIYGSNLHLHRVTGWFGLKDLPSSSSP